MSSPSARLRKVLSTPNKTSATGLSLVRIAWFTAPPASPAGTTSTEKPVSSTKAVKVSSVTPPAKESWEMMRSVPPGGAVASAPVVSAESPPHAAAIRATIAARIDESLPFLNSGPLSLATPAAWQAEKQSLRRYDPDQVQTVGVPQTPSQPGPAGLPRLRLIVGR